MFSSFEQVQSPVTWLAGEFGNAIEVENAARAASLVSLNDQHADQINQALSFPPREPDADVRKSLRAPWDEMMILHCKVVRAWKSSQYIDAYTHQFALVLNFLRDFSTMSNWCLPILYVINLDLRRLAIKADEQRKSHGEAPKYLFEATRPFNKAFSACITDRSPLNVSRKWGTYYIAGLLFKSYFKLDQLNLCGNVMKAIKSSSDLPSASEVPKAHQCTFRYYCGVLAFRDAKYKEAEEHFVFVYKTCPPQYKKNKQLVLKYLIPLGLRRGMMPSSRVLDQFQELKEMYGPFVDAIKSGTVAVYDERLEAEEQLLAKLGTFLAVEQGREVAKRTLFRKVWMINGHNFKLPLSHFQVALRCAGLELEPVEVEWYITSLIIKGMLRAYIFHSQQALVLSARAPFPPVHDVVKE